MPKYFVSVDGSTFRTSGGGVLSSPQGWEEVTEEEHQERLAVRRQMTEEKAAGFEDAADTAPGTPAGVLAPADAVRLLAERGSR